MARSESILTSIDNDTIHWTLSDSVFISIFDSIHKTGCAIEINENQLQSSEVKALFKQAEIYLKTSIKLCEVKLVGKLDHLNSLKSILSTLFILPKSSTERDKIGTKVLFYPQTGRLQVELPSLENPRKIKVMIVDDSATIRKLLSSIFSRDSEIDVVAAVEKPSEVEQLIEKLRPDVITLDIHMPEMDGVTLLKKFFPKFPTPIVLITSLSKEEGPLVLEALESGALDYIQKPSFEILDQMAPLIIEKIKMASQAKIKPIKFSSTTARRLSSTTLKHGNVIAIGSSTGGTEALKEILIRLPEIIPPIVIVQHIPAIFSLAFAKRMNELCPFEVKEATDGDEVIPGRVLIAPGGLQMSIIQSGGTLKASIKDSAPVNRHKPSVDVLFDSVAAQIGKKGIGVILTGMGSDGATGLLKMKEAGARTIAQDEASCVVFGMPKSAIRLGAAQEIKALLDIPELLVKWIST